jgi:hypothetical protein
MPCKWVPHIAQYFAASQSLPSTECEDVLTTDDIGATEKYFYAQKLRKDNQEVIETEGLKEARLRFFWNKACGNCCIFLKEHFNCVSTCS